MTWYDAKFDMILYDAEDDEECAEDIQKYLKDF